MVIGLVLATAWPFFDKSADAAAFDPARLQGAFAGKIEERPAAAALVGIAALPLAIAAMLF